MTFLKTVLQPLERLRDTPKIVLIPFLFLSVVVSLYLALLVHEGLHALVAWLCWGAKPTAISLGIGPRLFEGGLGLVQLQVNLFPLGGAMQYDGAAPITVHLGTIAAMVSAGPLANALLAYLMVGTGQGLAGLFWLVGGGVNMVLALALLPGFGDGNKLWECLHLLLRHYMT